MLRICANHANVVLHTPKQAFLVRKMQEMDAVWNEPDVWCRALTTGLVQAIEAILKQVSTFFRLARHKKSGCFGQPELDTLTENDEARNVPFKR